MATALGFSGEVADFYQRYRRGYPAEILDRIVDEFALTGDDVVLDLGCGTGQLTLPLAERVGAVVGMDPEPDMLLHAKARAPRNTSWMIGSDQDLPALGALIGRRALGAVTIGQALHWMNHEDLFRTARPLIRDGGGIAIVTNGTPLWLQDTPWSEALRGYLEHWLDTELTYACGTDDATQEVYRAGLEDPVRRMRGAGRVRRRAHARPDRRRGVLGPAGRVVARARRPAVVRAAGRTRDRTGPVRRRGARLSPARPRRATVIASAAPCWWTHLRLRDEQPRILRELLHPAERNGELLLGVGQTRRDNLLLDRHRAIAVPHVDD